MTRTLIAVLAAALLAINSACTTDAPVEPTPTDVTTAPTAPSPTPSETAQESPSLEPSATTSPTLELSEEQQAAVDAVQEYFRLQQEVDRDLDADLQALMEITDGNLRRMVSETLSQKRQLGQISRGTSVVNIWQVEEPEDIEAERRVVVYACLDSTGLETIDAASGEPAEGVVPQFLDYRLVTANRNGWKLIDGGNKVVESCPDGL